LAHESETANRFRGDGVIVPAVARSRAVGGKPPVGWRQYVGAFIRRCAVGVDHKVLVALVDGLQRRACSDVEDPANADDAALRRLAEVHREASREDDEGLILL
jgi:hypothetical protein